MPFEVVFESAYHDYNKVWIQDHDGGTVACTYSLFWLILAARRHPMTKKQAW